MSDALESKIEWKNTAENSFDSYKLARFVCDEGGKWEESYLVKNDKNLNTFSGVDGIPIKQYTLYEETETKCDFFDNDCDGNVNKGLKDCKIGGDGVAGEAQIIKENHPGFILGNAIFDYQTGKDELATEQKVNAKDK